MLRVKDLRVSFKKGEKKIDVLKGISLSIPEKKIVGLVGESGSGKSTIQKAIMGIVKYRGEIFLENETVERRDKKFYKRVQVIFQNPYGSLNPRLTIYKILGEPLLNFKIAGKRNLRESVVKLINSVGLNSEILYRTPDELSGGQLQRIAIARAISVNPDILIADEPMSGLDISIKAQIVNLFLNLHINKKLSILLISHDLDLVGTLSDYIYVIYNGEILERGDRDEIVRNHIHPYTKTLFNSSPSRWKDKSQLLKRNDPVKKNPKSICPFGEKCPNFSEKCMAGAIPTKKISNTHFVKCINIQL